MFKIDITTLGVGASAPLLAAIERPDHITRWQRVGVITRGPQRLHVDFDPAAVCLMPVWRACTAPTTARHRSLAKVVFGVFRGRSGVAVIASGAVTVAMGRRGRR